MKPQVVDRACVLGCLELIRVAWGKLEQRQMMIFRTELLNRKACFRRCDHLPQQH